MKRLPLLIFAALLALSPLLTPPASAYYDDVHYVLTYYICRQSGYTAPQAYRVASACSATDWDPETEPVQPMGQGLLLFEPAARLMYITRGFKPLDAEGQIPRCKFHAMRNEMVYANSVGKGAGAAEADVAVLVQRDALFEYALNVSKNPGVFLHAFQDEDPHRGFGSAWGHWPVFPGSTDEYKQHGLAIGGTSDWISHREGDVLNLTGRCQNYLQKFMEKVSPHQRYRPYIENEYTQVVRALALANKVPGAIDTELKRQLYIQFYAEANGIPSGYWGNLVDPVELSKVGAQLGVTLSPTELQQHKNGPNVDKARDVVNAALAKGGMKDTVPAGHFKYDLDSDGNLDNEYMLDDWVLVGSLEVSVTEAAPASVVPVRTPTYKVRLMMPPDRDGAQEYELHGLDPVVLKIDEPHTFENLPIGDLVVVVETPSGSTVRQPVTLLKRETILPPIVIAPSFPAAPSGKGPGFLTAGPKVYGMNFGTLKENLFLPQFAGTVTSATFTDPAGKGSGTATWTAPPKVIREGDRIELALGASKMRVKMTWSVWNEVVFQESGLGYPGYPASESADASFTFKLPEGTNPATSDGQWDRFWVSVRARANEGGPGYDENAGVNVGWEYRLVSDAEASAAEGAGGSGSGAAGAGPTGAGATGAGGPSAGGGPAGAGGPAGGGPTSSAGAPLDPSAWVTNTDGGTNVSMEGGRIVLTVPKDSGGKVYVFGKSPLSGDFDVTIDYELLDWQPSAETNLTLGALIQSQPALGAADGTTVSRVGTASEERLFVISSATSPRSEAALGGAAGRLRVQRAGARWTISQASGVPGATSAASAAPASASEWKAVATFENDRLGAAFMGFSLVREGPRGSARVAVRPNLASGQAGGAQPSAQPAGPRLVLEDVIVDKTGIDLNMWTIDEPRRGTSTLTAPWGRITYSISAPEVVFTDASTELVFDIEVTTPPKQRLNAVMVAPGDEVKRDPFERELQVYCESGDTTTTKTGRKVFKLSPLDYAAGTQHAHIWVNMQDGPRYTFKYRIER